MAIVMEAASIKKWKPENLRKKYFIPNAANNVIFKRAKAPKIEDRKRPCIELILGHLRSSICQQLSRSLNMTLFAAFGIRYNLLNSLNLLSS